MGQGRVCGGQSLGKKTPRTSNHSRPRGFYTNYSTKSLEAVDNFCTSVVARSTTCAATGSNIALGISIDVATPIQAVLRTEQEVIDHVEASCEGVLPPVGASDVFRNSRIIRRGSGSLRTELS